MWQGFVKHVGGNASEAASIYNSNDKWAKEIVADYNAQYFQRMEHQLMKQSAPQINSDSGFDTATAEMAARHETSVDKMKEPSRTSYVSMGDTLKEVSGVNAVDQDIQAKKETLKAGENDIQQNANTGLKNQKESLSADKKAMQRDFKESDEEWIGTKAGRAAVPWKELNTTSKKD